MSNKHQKANKPKRAVEVGEMAQWLGHLLLLERIWALFLAPAWWFIGIPNSSSEEYEAFF